MAIAGALEIQMFANIARLADDMKTATGHVSRAMSSIESSVSSAQNALSALGIGLSGAYFVSLIKGANDAMASMVDLGKETGISASALSRFEAPARDAGIGLEGVSKAMFNMSKAVLAANDPVSKQGQALTALGVSVKDLKNLSPDQMFELILRSANNYTDSLQKNAAMQDIFKRSGREMNVLAAEIAVKQELEATLTDAEAEAAKRLTREMIALQIEHEKTYRQIASQVSPVFLAFTKTLIDVGKEVGGIGDSVGKLAAENKIKEWATGMAIGVGMAIDYLRSFAAAIDIIVKGMAAMAADFVTYFGLIGEVIRDTSTSFAGMEQIIAGAFMVMGGNLVGGSQMITEGFAKISASGKSFKADLAAAFAETASHSQSFAADFDKIASDLAKNNFTDKLIVNLAQMDAAVTKSGGNLKVNFDPASIAASGAELKLYTSALQKYQEQLGKANQETLAEKAIYELTQGSLKGLTLEHKAGILAAAGEADEVKNAAEQQKAYDAILKEGEAAENKVIEAEYKRIESIGRLLDSVDAHDVKVKEETKLVGLSGAALAIENVEISRQVDLLKAQNPLEVALINARFDALKQDVTTLENLKAQTSAWTEMSVEVGKFFGDLVMNGKSAFDNLKTYLKSFLQQLIAIFAQRWFLQIVAGATGSAAVGNAAASVGANTLSGAVMSGLSDWFGSSTIGSNISGMASTFMSDPALVTFLDSGGATFLGAIGLFTAALVANAGYQSRGYTTNNNPGLATVFPEAGTDRILQALGMGSRGASNLTGSSGLAYLFGHGGTHADASGITGSVSGSSFSGSTYQDLSQRGGLFTSDRRWTDTTAMTSDQSAPFQNAITQIHDQMVTLGSSIGVDAAALLASYSAEFKIQLKDVSPADQAAAITAFIQRVYVEQAGIVLGQASKGIQDYVATFSGTATQIAAQFSDLITVLDNIGVTGIKGLDITTLLAWQQTGETLTQTLARVGTSYAQFVSDFTSDADKLAAAQKYVIDTFAAAGVAVPASNTAFRDFVATIDVSTDAGRHLFDTMMAVAPAFNAVGQAAASAASDAMAMANAAVAMANNFLQVYGSLHGSDSMKPYLNAQLVGMIEAFQHDSGLLGGLTAQAVANALSTVTPEMFAAIPQQFQAQALAIMTLYSQLMQQATQPGTVGTIDFTNAIIDLGNAAATAAAQAAAATQTWIDSLNVWLNGIGLNAQLSPLTAQQQKDEAQRQYVEDLMRAQGGDVAARAKITQDADAYLAAQKAVSGFGGDYSSVYSAIVNQIQSLANNNSGENRPLNAGDISALKQEVVDLKTVLARLLEIGNADNQEQTTEVIAALNAVANKLAAATTQAANIGATA
jgi:hypothetical protein